MDLNGKNVLLGVTSGVAAYKACGLIGKFKHMGATVKVIMTENATELITPRYFAELSGHPVACEMFDRIDQHEVQHISLANWAHIVIIAPATYNIIGKVASGIADDMLTTTIAAVPADTPVIFVPAMNTNMWEKRILQRNIATLIVEGYHFVSPVVGRLACGTEGIGKMAPSEHILKLISELE